MPIKLFTLGSQVVSGVLDGSGGVSIRTSVGFPGGGCLTSGRFVAADTGRGAGDATGPALGGGALEAFAVTIGHGTDCDAALADVCNGLKVPNRRSEPSAVSAASKTPKIKST